MNPLPEQIRSEAELDEIQSRPSAELVSMIGTLASPLVVLGAGGKMGPSLCVLAKRAADAAGHPLEVVGVSRFSDAQSRRWLTDRGVRTVACDLMDRDALAGLPDSANVAYLVGLKFGTRQRPSRTWAVNTLVPAHTAERYADARIVALSTGNVYPLVPVGSGGSVESDPLTPIGEYANAAVARERIFEHFAERQGTSITSIRLNYAVELRYGVLVDIATRVGAGDPVDVRMGYLNCIWQGDANSMVLRAFDFPAPPPPALNLTGAERLSVRELAERLGAAMGRPARVVGTEAPTALLSNTGRIRELLGSPPTPLDRVLQWTARWVREHRPTWNKPSHFEVRDGQY
jgi:nucleoside-diphosphate-sugar epimerase